LGTPRKIATVIGSYFCCDV